METIHDRRRLELYLKEYGIRELFTTFEPVFYLLHYARGELLTNPFSPSSYFQFIVDGELLLYDMPDESSICTLVTNYHQIVTLGDVELLDTDFIPFFVEAKTDVFSVAIFLNQYKEAMLNEPKFLRYLCVALSQKLQGATAASQNITLKERVERSLRRAEPGQEITGIAHLSKSLNVSSRQLLRVLNECCKDGVLIHEKKGVYRVVKLPG